MAIQTEPTRIATPFADSGTKNVIPETMAQPSATAAASWQAGFPTVCSLPLSAGGIPPARNDFNGLFNQMTQTERFLQDGGVYEWDSGTDYGANRLVLGSDGRLYWSMAQSGPNTGAGAVNPTADSGTYWGPLPIKTPSLADSSSNAATTDWVRSLAVAPVYVDPAGSDANDGMTAATAVQTLQRAIDVVEKLPSRSRARIYLASGTYTGDINVNTLNATINVNGNTTIDGNVNIYNGSNISIVGNLYSVTIKSFVVDNFSNVSVDLSSLYVKSIGVTRDSSFYASCQVFITNTSSLCLYVERNSLAYFNDSVAMTCSGADFVCYLHDRGLALFTGVLTISATNINTTILHIETGSYIHLFKNLSISGSGNTGGIYVLGGSGALFSEGITMGDCLSGGAALSVSYSQVAIYGDSTFWGSDNETALYIYQNANVWYGSPDTLVVNIKGAFRNAIQVDYGSIFRFVSSSTLQIAGTSGVTHNYAMSVLHNSVCYISNLSISGDYSCIAFVSENATFVLPASGSVVNNATGTRFIVGRCGQIDIGGASQGPNRLPGNAAGTGSNSTISSGYYG